MDLYIPPNMLPRTIVIAIVKPTSRNKPVSKNFFRRLMEIFQQMTTG